MVVAPTGHESVVAQLLDDICGMQSLVLYYENRIIQKRIALAEIMDGLDCQAENNSHNGSLNGNHLNFNDTAVTRSDKARRSLNDPSVRKMIESVLPNIHHSPFSYADLRKQCLSRYPNSDARILRGIASAGRWLLKSGILIKVEGGLKTVGNERLEP